MLYRRASAEEYAKRPLLRTRGAEFGEVELKPDVQEEMRCVCIMLRYESENACSAAPSTSAPVVTIDDESKKKRKRKRQLFETFDMERKPPTVVQSPMKPAVKRKRTDSTSAEQREQRERQKEKRREKRRRRRLSEMLGRDDEEE